MKKLKAGPFVKMELTDRFSHVNRFNGESPATVRKKCGQLLQRDSLDKLEIRLALFGFNGVFYSLTFSDEALPRNLRGVENAWNAYLKRLKKWRTDHGQSKDFDYVYRIEGKHGDRRWHLHAFLDQRDIPPYIVRALWDFGSSDAVKWNRRRVAAAKGFRGLAMYFTKEKPEVGKHRWGCSRSLSRKVPPCEISLQESPNIRIPPGALPLPADYFKASKWGVFSYVRYLEI